MEDTHTTTPTKSTSQYLLGRSGMVYTLLPRSRSGINIPSSSSRHQTSMKCCTNDDDEKDDDPKTKSLRFVESSGALSLAQKILKIGERDQPDDSNNNQQEQQQATKTNNKVEEGEIIFTGTGSAVPC